MNDEAIVIQLLLQNSPIWVAFMLGFVPALIAGVKQRPKKRWYLYGLLCALTAGRPRDPRRSRALAVKPAPAARRYAASELDRSTRPSKSVIRAANEHRRCARRRDAFLLRCNFIPAWTLFGRCQLDPHPAVRRDPISHAGIPHAARSTWRGLRTFMVEMV